MIGVILVKKTNLLSGYGHQNKKCKFTQLKCSECDDFETFTHFTASSDFFLNTWNDLKSSSLENAPVQRFTSATVRGMSNCHKLPSEIIFSNIAQDLLTFVNQVHLLTSSLTSRVMIDSNREKLRTINKVKKKWWISVDCGLEGSSSPIGSACFGDSGTDDDEKKTLCLKWTLVTVLRNVCPKNTWSCELVHFVSHFETPQPHLAFISCVCVFSWARQQ